MPRLLTLQRAARLVGVRRGALQSKIRSGELAAFEGMVAAEDLLRAYPQARLEDNSALERLEAIKDSAFARRMRERLLPSSEALVARLSELSMERAQVQAQLEHYRAIVDAAAGEAARAGGLAAAAAAAPGCSSAWSPPRTAAQPLLAQESFLRIMTAHVQVKPSGREFFVDGNDSLLEAALRAGLSLDYGCSIGSCGKCKARIVSGQVQRTRHSDYALTAAEKNAGVVLMCCNTALDRPRDRGARGARRGGHAAADHRRQGQVREPARRRRAAAAPADPAQQPAALSRRPIGVARAAPTAPARPCPWRAAPATTATCSSTSGGAPATPSPSACSAG